MKKYRVVKAYGYPTKGDMWGINMSFFEPGCIISGPLNNYDHVALQCGALEEVKPWEPKDGEQYYLAMPGYNSVQTWYGDSNDKLWFSLGFIYPTREQAEECRKRMLKVARKYNEEVLG